MATSSSLAEFDHPTICARAPAAAASMRLKLAPALADLGIKLPEPGEIAPGICLRSRCWIAAKGRSRRATRLDLRDQRQFDGRFYAHPSPAGGLSQCLLPERGFRRAADTRCFDQMPCLTDAKRPGAHRRSAVRPAHSRPIRPENSSGRSSPCSMSIRPARTRSMCSDQ